MNRFFTEGMVLGLGVEVGAKDIFVCNCDPVKSDWHQNSHKHAHRYKK